MGSFSAPISISNTHIHLCREDAEKLFGTKDIDADSESIWSSRYKKSIFKVNLRTPKGKIHNVRVLTPFTKETWIEVSRTNAFKLGIKPPLEIGELEEGQVIIEGPRGNIEVKKNVVIEVRHLKVTKELAEKQGLQDGQLVSAEICGPRAVIFKNVHVRIVENPPAGFASSIEFDTDEANAALVNSGDLVTIQI